MNRIMDLSLMWKTVWDVFPYFDRVPDWNETYREFLQRLKGAQPGKETMLCYAEFMARLGDGHSSYAFPRGFLQETGQLPFELLYTQQGYLVSACPAEWKSHLYARILSVNGRPFDELLQELYRYCYHVKDYIPRWQLQRMLALLLPENNVMETTAGQVKFSLHEKPEASIAAQKPQASMKYQHIGAGLLDIRLYEGNILYASMPDCQYAKAAEEIACAGQGREISGFILDLRDNIGGMTKIGGEVAQLFLPGEFSGCQKWTRRSKGIDFACGSQFLQMTPEELAQLGDGEDAQRCIRMFQGMECEEYTDRYGSTDHQALFRQPCVILTSRRTVSAAEDTLAFFRSNHRATVLGEATSGTTGTPCMVPLSQGSFRVCSVGYRLLDGTEFIGRGIRPDVEVLTTAEDLQNGKDAQLEAALRLLA